MIPPPDRGAQPDPGAWPEELSRLDVAVYTAIAATPTPALDLVFRRLSRAADYSRLWLASSMVLFALGGERGRRAAENGLASIVLTSTVVNLLLKPLGNRRRPDRVHRGRRPTVRPDLHMPAQVIPMWPKYGPQNR